MSDLFSLTRSTAIFNAIGEVTLHSLLANKKNIAHKSMNLIHICSFGHKYGTKDHSSSLCNFQNDCFCSFLASLSIFLFRLDSRLFFPFISSASPLSFRWTLSKAVTPAAFTAGKGGGFSTSSPAPEVLPPFPPPFFVKADILLGILPLLLFVFYYSFVLDYICNNNEEQEGSDLFQEEFLCFRSLLHYFLTAAALCVFGILFSFFSASSVRTYQRQRRLLLRIREVVSITITHDRRGDGE